MGRGGGFEWLARMGLVVWAASVGCGPGGGSASTPASVQDPDPPTYELAVDVRQTMLWILEPAAEEIWDSAGFVITAEGETDLSPTTDEGWDRVRQSAARVGESGNLLMLRGRSQGEDWVSYARAMIASSRDVTAAAERRDAVALFDTGGDLYQTCRACHTRYRVPIAQARNGY